MAAVRGLCQGGAVSFFFCRPVSPREFELDGRPTIRLLGQLGRIFASTTHPFLHLSCIDTLARFFGLVLELCRGLASARTTSTGWWDEMLYVVVTSFVTLTYSVTLTVALYVTCVGVWCFARRRRSGRDAFLRAGTARYMSR